jgi:hypothetical protein
MLSNIFLLEINMKFTNMKLIGLWAGIVLAFCSFYVYAEESHISQAITHAEAAAKATGGKAITEHAEAAKTHAKTADEHLDAGIKSLDDAIEHGKLRHDDLAKKSAEEAVTHLKAAR